MWPFRTKPRRVERLSIRELREALTRTSDDDRAWIVDYLAGVAPTATVQALKDLTRMKDHAAAGGFCLKCGKTWPLPTALAYVDGVHGFVCDEPPCTPRPLPLTQSAATQPVPALTTPQGGTS